MDKVILFKAPPEDDLEGADPYVDQLQRDGFSCSTVPVIVFEYCNLNVLSDKLGQPENYSGIIFGSPRCVSAVAKCSPLRPEWKSKHAYVVGEATARQVAAKLGMVPEGEGTGDGAHLAQFILTRKPPRPLLLPCGNLARDTIAEVLREADVKIDQAQVYLTQPNPLIEPLIEEYFRTGPQWVVFFSPSGVNASLPVIQRLSQNLAGLRMAAIGPTTRDHLLSLNLLVSAVAEKPTPAHLAQAISSACRKS